MRRPPQIRASLLRDELVVDNFAGGGGASEGIEQALGRPVDIAINHSPEAIAMHRANHPETKHYLENIWEVDPRDACGSRPVGLAWFSPDCTHFSRAKGTQPLERGTRSLAWVVIRWAKLVKPRVILLENVEEFQSWGRLDERGRPDSQYLGETFRQWLGELVSLGYHVEFRSLVAADYGTPTTRRRLFLVARRDGAPIVWPEPTHGKGRPESWRPASEIIDWSLPCPSIFERKRPLAEATLRRIAAGIRRYVVESPRPFLIKYHGGGRGYTRGQACDEPLRTIDTSNRFGLVEPFVLPVTHQADRSHRVTEPLRTITGAHRGELALVEPFVVRHGHYSTITGAGLREGCGAGTFRGQPLGGPAALHKQSPGTDVRVPLGTITTKDHNVLTAAFLLKFYGTSTGAHLVEPLPTVTSGGGRGGGHLAEVRAFLLKYYGAEGRGQAQALDEPLHTVTTKARFGLVMIAGEPWQIVDVGMRMLAPRELFNAQGFPPDYEIAPEHNGKPLTKTAQTSLAGNSVCSPVAKALVRANVHGGVA